MDDFKNRTSGLDSPAFNGAELAGNDGADLAHTTRALWIGGVGDISVVLASGDAVTFKNASGWMPLRVQRLNATGTTATDIVAVW